MNILRTSARTRNNSAALEREKGVPEANYKNEYAFGKDLRVEHIEAELLIAIVFEATSLIRGGTYESKEILKYIVIIYFASIKNPSIHLPATKTVVTFFLHICTVLL